MRRQPKMWIAVASFFGWLCCQAGCVFGPEIDEAITLDQPPFIEEVQPTDMTVSFNLNSPNPSRVFRASRILDFDLPDNSGITSQFTLQIADNPPIAGEPQPLILAPVQNDETRLQYSTTSYSFSPCENPDVAGGAQNGTLTLEIVDDIPANLQRDESRASWSVFHVWFLRFEGECPEPDQ